MDYKREFDVSLSLGEQGEKWIENLIRGDGDTTFEVKTDLQAFDTGNIYLEETSWGKPSGINVTTADYWVFNVVRVPHKDGATRTEKVKDYKNYKLNNDDIVSSVIVKTSRLLEIKDSYAIRSGGDYNSSNGRLIPIKDLSYGSKNNSRSI